jgi:hypothetical protein
MRLHRRARTSQRSRYLRNRATKKFLLSLSAATAAQSYLGSLLQVSRLDGTDRKLLLALRGVGPESEAASVRFHARGVTKVGSGSQLPAFSGRGARSQLETLPPRQRRSRRSSRYAGRAATSGLRPTSSSPKMTCCSRPLAPRKRSRRRARSWAKPPTATSSRTAGTSTICACLLPARRWWAEHLVISTCRGRRRPSSSRSRGEFGDRVGVLAHRADFTAMRKYFGDSIKGTSEERVCFPQGGPPGER